jgi:hypothetical protein
MTDLGLAVATVLRRSLAVPIHLDVVNLKVDGRPVLDRGRYALG